MLAAGYQPNMDHTWWMWVGYPADAVHVRVLAERVLLHTYASADVQRSRLFYTNFYAKPNFPEKKKRKECETKRAQDIQR